MMKILFIHKKSIKYALHISYAFLFYLQNCSFIFGHSQLNGKKMKEGDIKVSLLLFFSYSYKMIILSVLNQLSGGITLMNFNMIVRNDCAFLFSKFVVYLRRFFTDDYNVVHGILEFCIHLIKM